MVMLKPGKRVYYIHIQRVEVAVCSTCNGRGYQSWEDDWGMYKSSVCGGCGGLGQWNRTLCYPIKQIIGPTPIIEVILGKDYIKYKVGDVVLDERDVYTSKREAMKRLK